MTKPTRRSFLAILSLAPLLALFRAPEAKALPAPDPEPSPLAMFDDPSLFNINAADYPDWGAAPVSITFGRDRDPSLNTFRHEKLFERTGSMPDTLYAEPVKLTTDHGCYHLTGQAFTLSDLDYIYRRRYPQSGSK